MFKSNQVWFRFLATYLALIVLCAFSVTTSAYAAEPGTTGGTAAKAPAPTEYVLPNGLKVLLLEDHTFPVVSCLSWYRVGSRDEKPGTTGISHLLEHLLFGKVGSFRRGEIGASIARVGGQFNGYTSDDFTTFFETLPSQRLELALRIESERMRGAQFSDADVQEEISNVQREFETMARDPNSLLEHEVRSMLYSAHPYRNPIIGYRAEVDGISAAQVKAYYDRYFGPNNCTLVIAGDFQSKPLIENVQKYFGGIPKAPNAVAPAKLQQEPVRAERRSTIKYPGKQEIMEMAFHAPSLSDPDAPAMVVLEKLLNSPYSGRLRSTLVNAKVCSSASAAFEPKKDPGFFGISCVAIPATPSAQQKIIEGVDGLLAQLRSQPVSDAELRRARNQAEFAFCSETEGPYRAGFHLGYFDTLSNWKNTNAWLDQIRAVNAADLQRVAKKYFSGDNRVIAWLAGSNAPKPVVPKTEPATPPSTPPKPGSKPEHVRLTGYKDDDTAVAPDKKKAPPSAPVMREWNQDKKQLTEQSIKNASDKKTPNMVSNAVQKMPSAIPSAVQNLPKAIGNAPGAIKELPSAVEKVPTVIKNIPNAVGNIPTVIRQLPSTVGNMPNAIKELPGAIGGMPGAAANVVKELPGAIVGIPATAASVIREVPQAIGNIPGATAGALKAVPAAIGSFATGLGGIPSAIGHQMFGPQELRVANGTARRQLKNGITLVVHRSQLTPVVQIIGASRAGTAYEPAGKRGVSDLTVALFNLGNARRGKSQLATIQEDLGIQPPHMVSFDNGLEKLQFSTRCLSRDVYSQLDIIAETLLNPTYADADFDKAKQDALNDLQRHEDNAERKADRALYRSVLAQGSPFVPDAPSELSKSISNLSVADVKKFVATSISPSDTTIVMVGDIDPEAAVSMVEKAFAEWVPHGARQRLSAHPNARQVTRAAVPSKDKTTTIAFGRLVTGLNTSGEYAQMLIADTAFSKHPILSRLGQKLADDQAFAKAVGSDSIDTSMQRFADGATWCLNIDVEPNTVPLTVKALQSELERFGKEGISQTEFVEARRYLLGSIPVRGLGTLSATARTLLDGALRSEGEDPEATLLASVRNSTLEGVNKAIKHSLRPDGATLVVVGSAQSLRATRPQVAAGQQQQAQQQPQAAQPSAGDPPAAADKEVSDTASGA